MLKTLFGIYWILFAMFIAFKNMHVFKIFIFAFKNVHPILDFLTRRGKFIHIFLIFIYFSMHFSSRNLFKKNTRLRRLGRAQPTARPVAPLLSPHDAAARV